MSTIKSSAEDLILNADGSSSEVKIQQNGSERLRITSTGYVDIGASDVRLTLGSQGTAGNNDANWIRGNGTSLSYNAASANHIWETGGTMKMKIDSSGYVFMAKMATTFCRLKGPSSVTAVSGSWTIMVPWENPDDLYNASNGRFTCPVDGLYLMNTMSINSTSHNNTTSAEPYKNGSELPGGRMYASQSQNHTSGSATVLTRCSAGDYLQWRYSGVVYDNNHANANFMLVHAE